MYLGGGNSNIFLCSSRNLGKKITHFGPFNLFQMGWVNQPPTKTYLHQIWSDQFPPRPVQDKTVDPTKFPTLLTRKIIYTQLPEGWYLIGGRIDS